MIIITGAAGFIGSCLLTYLNQQQFTDLVLVDDFSRKDKQGNFRHKQFTETVPRYQFFSWVKGKEKEIQAIIHLGARTDTTELNPQVFEVLNLRYSQKLWELSASMQIPFIYASSAATYGQGEQGFADDHDSISSLRPLNPYGKSKHAFDCWAMDQKEAPFFWAGVKFFNVYGPNEFHKRRMASVIYHAYGQIHKTGKLKLFRSHNDAFEDGKQLRDFIYVKDVVQVIYFLLQQRTKSGIYNLGTGQARTFLDLGKSVFRALDMDPEIEFIDTPEDIRETYQYFTEANMGKLRTLGYKQAFYSLEEGIKDYVKGYLMNRNYY